MDLGMGGKRALVIGGSGNTGLEVVKALAGEGCTVAAVARDGVRLNASAQVPGVKAYPADLMEPGALDEVVGKIGRELGAPDIIVHVIGGSLGIRDSMVPAADWAKVWQFNLGIAIDINRAFLPAMEQKGWGRIVHFSTNGVKVHTGGVPYTSSKHAVEGYVRNMSKLFSAKGVVISAVSPGPIYTEGRFLYSQNEEWNKAFFEKYVPMGRWGRGEELARVVAFLCSEAASYMAGAIVEVDGGMR